MSDQETLPSAQSSRAEYRTAYGFKPGEFDIWREVEDEGDAPLLPEAHKVAEEKTEDEAMVEPTPIANSPETKDDKKVLTLTEAQVFLSYPDVLKDQELHDSLEYVLTNPSAKKYSETLVTLSEKYDANLVLHLATGLRDVFYQDAKILGLEPSAYGKSQSWALWDIAKQFYLSEHPDESDGNLYELGNPMDTSKRNDKIRRQIVYRHLGWEYERASKAPDFTPALLNSETRETIERLITTGERNQSGQLRSYVLSDIGEVLALAANKMKTQPNTASSQKAA